MFSEFMIILSVYEVQMYVLLLILFSFEEI